MLLRRVKCWLDPRHLLVIRKYVDLFPPNRVITLQDVKYHRKWLTPAGLDHLLDTQDGSLGRLMLEEWKDVLWVVGKTHRTHDHDRVLLTMPFRESSRWEELYAYKMHVEQAHPASILDDPMTSSAA